MCSTKAGAPEAFEFRPLACSGCLNLATDNSSVLALDHAVHFAGVDVVPMSAERCDFSPRTAVS